jgi:hypothetical protein
MVGVMAGLVGLVTWVNGGLVAAIILASMKVILDA